MPDESIQSLTLTVIIGPLLASLAWADGQGDRLIWSEGSLLELEMRRGSPHSDQDELFNVNGEPSDDGDSNNDLLMNNLISKLNKIKVSVVAPGKELTKMMNFISTKSRVMFLRDFEHYFKTLKVGSTSRPMLLTHLGLAFASDKQINSWYEQQSRSRIQNKLVESCKNLLRVRDNALGRSLDEVDIKFLDELKANQRLKLNQIVYITFRENLNLFMLEEFLLLCSRLEPEEMAILGQAGEPKLGLLFKDTN